MNTKISRDKIIAIASGIVIVLGFAFVGLSIYRFAISKGQPAPAAYSAAYLNNSGDYTGAQNFLFEKMKNDSSPELKLFLAASYLDQGVAQGNRAEASKKAQDVLFGVQRYYQGAYLYDLIAYSYEIVGDYNNALGYYGRSLILDSKSVNTLFGIGRINWLKGDLEKAKKYYNMAEASITPATDRSVVAKVYAAQGAINSDPKKSEEYFTKAASFAASKALKSEVYSNLSQAIYLQNDFAKAAGYASLAINSDPTNASGYIAYAKAAIAGKDILQKNARGVEEYLTRAIFLAPRKAEAQYWMGKFDFAFGKYDLAVKSYDTARIFIPNDDTLNKPGKDALMADVLFDEAAAYAFNKDNLFKVFLTDAFKYNPAKTLYMIDSNPELKKMMAALVLSNSK